MSSFCAGICARIERDRVQFLCVQHHELRGTRNQGELIVFPGGNNIFQNETSENILKRVLTERAGIFVESSFLIAFNRQAINSKSSRSDFCRYFWLVTQWSRLPKEEELSAQDPPSGVLRWFDVEELRGVIYYTHRLPLISAIRRLAKLDADFTWPLLEACPDLFSVK